MRSSAAVLLLGPRCARGDDRAALLRSAGHALTVEHRRLGELTSSLQRFALILCSESHAAPGEIAAAREATDAAVIVEYGQATEPERIAWLESGADACVSETMGTRELLAVLDAWLRRSPGRKTLDAAEISIDLAARRATYRGRVLDLTLYELRILEVLVAHPDTVLSRDALMGEAKGSVDASFDRSIDVHICRLRSKLENPGLLKTVRGAGYMLRSRLE